MGLVIGELKEGFLRNCVQSRSMAAIVGLPEAIRVDSRAITLLSLKERLLL